MATVDIKKALSSIGLEAETLTFERSPYDLRNRFKIEGYISNLAALSYAGKEQNVKKEAGKLLNDIITRGSVPAALLVKKDEPLAVKKILKNGDYMTVLWEDGTKTIVKRAPDEPESDYAAFTAALGIRVFGSNSALKRIVESAEVQGKKKKKSKTTKVGEPFDKVGEAFCKSAVALIEEMAKLREAEYEQQKTDEWLDGIEKKNDNRS